MFEQELLELAISIGYHLQMCGAEIYRVEAAVNRLLKAYGVPGDVFAIPNCLIVTVCPDNGRPMTRMRRIGYHGTDINAIEQFYGLARQLCREKPPIAEALLRLQRTKQHRVYYSLPVLCLGYFLAAGFFGIQFGGTWTDGILSGLCGVVVGLFLRAMTVWQVNPFFQNITGAFIIAFVSQTLTHIGAIRYADAAAIGALMLLVPGMAFTDSMRDIIYGDTLSGINRLAQVFLTAAALLLGTGTALGLSNLLWHSTASLGIHASMHYPALVQCLAGAIACGGFCLLYNIRLPGVFICMAGAFLSWAVYLGAQYFDAGVYLANFFAAVAVSLYAELMARIRKFPSFSYLVIALLPLVPGSGVYYTVEYMLEGAGELSLRQGVRTAAIAGVLAVGVLLVSSLFKMVENIRRGQYMDKK